MPTLRLDGDARGAVRAVADVATETKTLTKGMTDAEAATLKLAKAAQMIAANKKIMKEAAAEAKQYKQEADQVGHGHKAAFGETALLSVTRFFGAMVGPAALIAGATRALANYNAELEKLGSQLKADIGNSGESAQLAVTSSNPLATMGRLDAEARRVWASGATNTLGEASQLVFGLEQATVTDPKQRETLIGLQTWGAIKDVKVLAPAIAAARTAFKGLSTDKLTALTTIAGIDSPGGAGELLKYAGKAMAQGEKRGYSPGTITAAVGLLSKVYGGPSEGETHMSQFMKHLATEGFKADPSLKGMNFDQQLQRVASATDFGRNSEKLHEFFGGRLEAQNAALTLMGNRAEVVETARKADLGGAGLLDLMIDINKGRPGVSTAVQSRATDNQRSLSRMRATEIDLQYRSMVNDVVARSGYGAMGTGLLEASAWLQGLSTDQQTYRLMKSVEGLGPGEGSEVQQATVRLLEEIFREMREMNGKTPQPTPGRLGRQE